jgi:hypothetical protein
MEIYEYINAIIDIMKRLNDEPKDKNVKQLFSRIVLLGNKMDMEHYR